MAALRVINRGKKCNFWKRNFFILSFLVLRREDICWIPPWHRNGSNALLPAQSSHLPMDSGYKNHVQHACPEKHSQGTKTSEQQTANFLSEGFNSPEVLNILFKKGTSVLPSERTECFSEFSRFLSQKGENEFLCQKELCFLLLQAPQSLRKLISWGGKPPPPKNFDNRNSWCSYVVDVAVMRLWLMAVAICMKVHSRFTVISSILWSLNVVMKGYSGC